MDAKGYEERVLEMVGGIVDRETAVFLTMPFYWEVFRIGREEPFSSLADSIHCAGIIGAGRMDATMELDLRKLYTKAGFGNGDEQTRPDLVLMANAGKAIYTQLGAIGDERRKSAGEPNVYPVDTVSGGTFLEAKPRSTRLSPTELRGALQTGRRSFMPYMIFDDLGRDDKNAVVEAVRRELTTRYGREPVHELIMANVINYRQGIGSDPRQAFTVLLFELVMLNFVSLPLGASLCHDIAFDGDDVLIRVSQKKLNRGSIMPCVPLTRPA